MTADIPVLYVLMRTDLPDYQPGKAMAQANHAGTKFMKECSDPIIEPYRSNYVEWIKAGDGFGTCVVLGTTYAEMRRSVAAAHESGFMHGIVHDPSYPIRDGDQTQHLPIDTCGYIFGRKSRLEGLLGGFKRFH